MKKSIAKKWVAALRSGRYAQGHGCLRGNGLFCCLGVLCDLHSTTTNEGRWDRNNMYQSDSESEEMVPPEDVCAWAGLTDCNPTVPGDRTIAELNDNGVSFAEIADKIEANWEKL